MKDFIDCMLAIFQGFQLTINIYGFSFTLWQITLFILVSSLVGYFIGRLLSN